MAATQSDGQWQAFSSSHPSADLAHLRAFSLSSHKCPCYLLEYCCNHKFSPNTPTKKGCSWETCLHLTHVGFSSFIRLFFPSFPDSFLTGYLRTTCLWLCCAKKARVSKGKGTKWAQRLGGWATEASEREPGMIFPTLSHTSLHNARPLPLLLHTLYPGASPFQP